MPRGNIKGSFFERDICRKLSFWWSNGERDDIFWRSSQSGGRATQRMKRGKKTAGSYGDIVALDPIGAPLTNYFTIELKVGKSHGHPGDMIDVLGDGLKQPWMKTMQQAIYSSWCAGSVTWLLICKRDRREAMVYFPVKNHGHLTPLLSRITPIAKFRIRTINGPVSFIGLPLDKFFKTIKPETFSGR